MTLKHLLCVQSVPPVTSRRTVFVHWQMEGRRVNVAALLSFHVILEELKEDLVEHHFLKLCVPNVENSF